jgi:hypothetical protein
MCVGMKIGAQNLRWTVYWFLLTCSRQWLPTHCYQCIAQLQVEWQESVDLMNTTATNIIFFVTGILCTGITLHVLGCELQH